MKLMKQKDELEKAIMDITEHLTAPGMPGLKGNLKDEEGFPRADLDLFEITKLRNRLACLQTDHVGVMKNIEQGLFRLHEDHYKKEEVKEGVPIQEVTQRLEQQSMGSESGEANESKQAPELKIPFAWISDVLQDSPAQQAGLKIGDAIYKFGPINHQNHDNLRSIVTIVTQMINQEIEVKVLRKTIFGTTEDKELKFVPREWSGRGLLGCALKPNPV